MKRLSLFLALVMFLLIDNIIANRCSEQSYSSACSYNLLSSDGSSLGTPFVYLSSGSDRDIQNDKGSSSSLSEEVSSRGLEESVLDRALNHIIHRRGHELIPVFSGSVLIQIIRRLARTNVPEVVANECTHVLSLSALQRELNKQGIDLEKQIVEVPRVGDDIFLATENICVYVES